MCAVTLLNWRIALLLLLSLNIMKLNVANPATGAQKLFDFEDERQTYVVFRYLEGCVEWIVQNAAGRGGRTSRAEDSGTDLGLRNMTIC